MNIRRLPGALGHPGFALFLSARFLATFAVQMQGVAIGWQVYEITGNALDLGLIGLAQFLPFFVLVLPAGQVADRLDRRLILATCYFTEVLCAALLLAFTLYGLKTAWPVFAVLMMFGSARAFAMPASQAITPNLVPREMFANAIALNSSTFHIATIAGPAMGGILYAAGAATVYGIVTLLLAVSVALMLLVRTPAFVRSAEPPNWHTVLEGLRFVRSRPVVLGAISLDLFAVLFGGATALLPIFARDVLATGPAGLGLLRSAPAIGAAVTAAVLAVHPITRSVGRWMFGGVALFGASTIVFALSKSFALSVAALAILGSGDMISVYIRHMLIQLETPDAIRGRVSAVNAVFIGASNELGEFESGVTAAWLGLVRSVVLGGLATIAVTGLWMRIFPMLRTMDRFPGSYRGDEPDLS
ncbi:MAG TPA: MFS transporter [Candidatus Limnocylindrales bacterium]|nr:MFS transporter [Candidatus Limnocylindrales bacterium]